MSLQTGAEFLKMPPFAVCCCTSLQFLVSRKKIQFLIPICFYARFLFLFKVLFWQKKKTAATFSTYQVFFFFLYHSSSCDFSSSSLSWCLLPAFRNRDLLKSTKSTYNSYYSRYGHRNPTWSLLLPSTVQLRPSVPYSRAGPYIPHRCWEYAKNLTG